jgi:hypothetical protein
LARLTAHHSPRYGRCDVARGLARLTAHHSPRYGRCDVARGLARLTAHHSPRCPTLAKNKKFSFFFSKSNSIKKSFHGTKKKFSSSKRIGTAASTPLSTLSNTYKKNKKFPFFFSKSNSIKKSFHGTKKKFSSS